MIRAQTKQNQRRTKRVIAKVKQEVRIRVVYQSEGGWADPRPSFFKPALPSMHVNECVKQALSSRLHTLTEHIRDYQLSPTQNTSCKLTKERQTHRAELWLPFRLMFGKKRAHLLWNRKWTSWTCLETRVPSGYVALSLDRQLKILLQTKA